MLKIGIDTQVLQYKEASGFGFYVENLYQALLLGKPNDIKIVGLKSQWEENLPTWKRWYHDRFELPMQAQKHDIAILHQPCFSCPKYNKKVVWTLHDLRPLVLKEPMSLPASLYWRNWLPYSAHHADQIVCISENTRQDAIKHLHIPQEKIEVIPVGVPQSTLAWQFNSKKAYEYKEKFKINQPYFCTVATLQPIKNIPFLIDIFVALRREFNVNYQLVIIGKKSWDYDNVVKRLVDHHLTEGKEVIITDYVSEDEKLSLMHESEVFLFPSLYEGFGIPPIEAQAIGVPVIASDVSSLPDVVGDGGILCSPNNTNDWVKAYERLQKERSQLITRGQQNIKRFYWDTIAKQWLDVYTNLSQSE